MGAIQELDSIRKIASTVGFKRAGDKDNYLAFVTEQAAKEQQQIDSIVSDTNRLMREVEEKKRQEAVREERRRLARKETPEVYQVIPRVNPADLNNLTDEQVTQKIADAVKMFRSRIEISKADFTLLCNFLEQNSIDATSAAVWEKALQFIIDRLTLIENGGAIPTPVEAPQVKPEDVNPYSFSSHPQSAYAQWEKQHLQDQNYAEVMPVVRAALEEIVSYDSKDLLPESIDHLIKVMTNKQRPFTRAEVRKTFLDIWAGECSQEMLNAAFTPQELRDYRNDVEDRHLSSEQIKAKYVYGHRS
jgi:hypothetical protein